MFLNCARLDGKGCRELLVAVATTLRNEDLTGSCAHRTEEIHDTLNLLLCGDRLFETGCGVNESSASFQGVEALEYERRRKFAIEVGDREIYDDAPKEGVRIPHRRGPLVFQESKVCLLYQLLGILARAASPSAHPYELGISRQYASHCHAALRPRHLESLWALTVAG